MASLASFKRRKSSVRNVASLSSSNLHIPEDIMIDILSRLPVKSLMRFSCVSKTWLSLVHHNSNLVSKHLTHSILNTKGGNLLVTSQQTLKFVQIFDVNTGPYTDSHIYLDVFLDGDFDGPIHSGEVLPSPWTLIEERNIICSNNGLLCIDARNYHSYVIWNPATRQFREIPKLELYHEDEDEDEDEDADIGWRFLGFGVDEETDDYKLISLDHPHYILDENQNHICLTRVNYLYSKSTGLWRDVDAPALTTHRTTVDTDWSQIQIKGVLYWVPRFSMVQQQIMGFEIREEKFSLLAILPDDYYKSSKYGSSIILARSLTEIEGSLALITSNMDDNLYNVVHNIWMMNNNEESWVQKFTVREPCIETLKPIRGWKNCLVSTSISEESDDQVELILRRVDGVVRRIKNLSIPRDYRYYSLKVHSYVESLTSV